MVAPAVLGSPQGGGAPAGGGPMVPFILASNVYVEKFDSFSSALGTSAIPHTVNVIPNGFLSGVRLEQRATGGTTGTLAADGPPALYTNIELDNIDGANIVYPMQGWSHYIGQWMYRPWNGDPARRFDWGLSNNPSSSLFIQPEVRGTAGVLANTDARSQYKISYTLNTTAGLISGAGTNPTVTVNAYLETWAQPDARDLQGNPQEAVPPGLNLQTLRRHQILTLNGPGSANTFQLANTGNELRGFLLVVRDTNGVRQDFLTDPIRVRLDTRALGTFSPNEVFNQMGDFYDQLANGTSQRPTGVYMWPRFRDPGDFQGTGWLATTNATYLILETATSAAASGTGTVEIITDEAIPVGMVPAELESI